MSNPSIVYLPSEKLSYTRTRNELADAYADASMTMKFWELTGVPLCQFNFVTKNDLGPVLTNAGEFITVD